MQRFNYTWEYRPGRLNVADPISRSPLLAYMKVPILMALVLNSIEDDSFRRRIAEGYLIDPWFQDLANLDQLSHVNGLYRKQIAPATRSRPEQTVVVIPDVPELKKEIIENQHSAKLAGHPGRDRTLELIQRNYWWPNMRADVEDFVAHCEQCQRNKASNQRPAGLLSPLPIPDMPWDSVGIDFIVGLPASLKGHNAIAVFIDRLTKMVHLAPTTTTVTAAQTADLFIWNVVRFHGMPKDTITDRGTQFAGTFWKAVLKQLGAKAKFSSAYHPQTDGQTERANRVVADTLRNYCDQAQTYWDEHLPIVEFAINNSTSSATEQTPFYLNYGFHPRTPAVRMLDPDTPAARNCVERFESRMSRAKKCLQAARERMKAIYDRGHRPQTFVVGDKVLLSTKNLTFSSPRKFMPKFLGPFEVTKSIGEQAYRLELPANMKVHDVFHTSLLRPYRSDGTYQPPPAEVQSGKPYFVVEKILDHDRLKKRGVKYKFLVRWQGYSAEHDTWEPESSFAEPALIDEYLARVGAPPRT